MSGHSIGPQDPPIADAQRHVLAQLQRLYGRRSIAPDVFGRRPALPSEIERLAKVHQQPPAPADTSLKAQHKQTKTADDRRGHPRHALLRWT